MPAGRPARFGPTTLVAMRLPDNVVTFLDSTGGDRVGLLVSVITTSNEYKQFLADRRRKKKSKKKKVPRGTK